MFGLMHAGSIPLPKSIGSLKLWFDSRYASPGTFGSAVDRVTDLSGNNNHFSAIPGTRPTYLNGQLKGGTRQSIYFSTPGPSYMRGASVSFPTGFSAFVTFKTLGADTTSTQTGDPPMTIFGSEVAAYRLGFGLNAGVCEYRYWNGSVWTTVSGGTSLNDGNVHTIAVSHDSNGAVRLYTDGVLRASSAITYSTSATTLDSFGAGRNNADWALDCNVGEAMAWDKAITAEQVAALHTRGFALWK